MKFASCIPHLRSRERRLFKKIIFPHKRFLATNFARRVGHDYTHSTHTLTLSAPADSIDNLAAVQRLRFGEVLGADGIGNDDL